MSLKLELKNDRLTPKKIALPSRYYLFSEGENYLKLLTVGEGIFPNDKICTELDMVGSNLILASESALKVYPSEGNFAVNRTVINLQERSNLEFLSDEVILFKNARFLQLFSLRFDAGSTFFYSSILSGGRSDEEYGFEELAERNRFIYNGEVEYLERFRIKGESLREYAKRHGAYKRLFAKIYIRVKDNEAFGELLLKEGVESFERTKSGAILVCIITGERISQIKDGVNFVWGMYRGAVGKKSFDLGKR
ncbi:MAG: urease accessory protein UreD [Campylobacteraceae bacterium]|jgi:urease accessory protein|nr:urease accessory protein UreD [Campylobacteraceae bacterium]